METGFDIVVTLVTRGPGGGVGEDQGAAHQPEGHGDRRHHRLRRRHGREEGDPEADRHVHPGRRLHLGDPLDLRHHHGVRAARSRQIIQVVTGVHRLDRRDRRPAHIGAAATRVEIDPRRAAVAGDQLPRRLRRPRQGRRQGHGRDQEDPRADRQGARLR